MKTYLSLIIALVSVVSMLLFLFNLLPGVILIFKGDVANGTEIVINATSDEIISITYQSIIVNILIALLSALGLTGIVTLLRKL
jgi:hypothetical protein